MLPLFYCTHEGREMTMSGFTWEGWRNGCLDLGPCPVEYWWRLLDTAHLAWWRRACQTTCMRAGRLRWEEQHRNAPSVQAVLGEGLAHVAACFLWVRWGLGPDEWSERWRVPGFWPCRVMVQAAVRRGAVQVVPLSAWNGARAVLPEQKAWLVVEKDFCACLSLSGLVRWVAQGMEWDAQPAWVAPARRGRGAAKGRRLHGEEKSRKIR